MSKDRFGIVNLRYTARGRGAAGKMNNAVKYYTYRDGKDVGDRRWTCANGETLTPSQAKRYATEAASTHGFTYQIVLSCADGVDIEEGGYKAFLDNEGFKDYILIEHHNTENSHAHVLAWRSQVISKKDIGGFIDRYDGHVEMLYNEYEKNRTLTRPAIDITSDLLAIVEQPAIDIDTSIEDDTTPFFDEIDTLLTPAKDTLKETIGYYGDAIRQYPDSVNDYDLSLFEEPEIDFYSSLNELVFEPITPDFVSLIESTIKHQPQRHGLMESLETRQRTGRKYTEVSTPPNKVLIASHMAGRSTLAVPAQVNGLATAIVLDIDGNAQESIPILLKAAQDRGISAWGELQPSINRGYVWAVYDRVVNADALALVGDELIAGSGLSSDYIDNRTANASITRLPFGVHQWTNSRGLVILQDGSQHDLNQDFGGGVQSWIENHTENKADLVPIPRDKAQDYRQSKVTNISSSSQLKATFNNSVDITDILDSHGGRRSSRTLWHCPCGCHQNHDANPSLLIRPSKDPDRFGEYIVQGYSPHCGFYSDKGKVWDAFNVDMVLNDRTYIEQIKHVRQELGLVPERPQQRKRLNKNQPEQGD